MPEIQLKRVVHKKKIPSRQTLSLHQFDQFATLRETSGDYIADMAILEAAAERLNATVAFITERRKTAPEYDLLAFLREQAEGRIAAILDVSQWQYFDERPDLDRVLRSHRPRVYFAKYKRDLLHTIKIGYTTKEVRRRMSQIEREQRMNDLPYPIAVIETPSIQAARDLEYWLHQHFEADRVIEEWFREQPVLWYINYHRSLSQLEQEQPDVSGLCDAL